MQVSICGGVGGNTGGIACDVRKGIPKVPVIGSRSFTPAEYATAELFETNFVAATKLATGDSNKLFPFPEIQSITNNTEANVTATAGLGLQFILREGKPAYQFGVVIGSTQEKYIRKFNREIVPMFMLDDSSKVWGKTDKVENFQGALVQVFVSPKPWSDGNGVESEYTLVTTVYQNTSDFSDNAAVASTDLTPSDLEGLVDVYGSEPVAHTANVHIVALAPKSTSLTNKPNIYALYGDELADGDVWVAKTGATFGTTLAITGVVKNAANSGWAITLDSTAYTALPANAKIQLQLVGPAALDAADIFDIESVPFYVVKTA